MISVARSIVPPVVAPAPTVEWISSMKRMARGRAASARMTALKRSSKSPRKRVPASSAPESSEKTSAPFSRSGTSSCSSRVARPSAIAVLPTPASPTNTGLFLRRRQSTSIVRCSSSVRPIERIEQALARAVGQVHAVGLQRIGRRRRTLPRRRRTARRAPSASDGPGVRGRLGDAVRDVVEDVEPRDAVRAEQPRGLRLVLLHDGRQDVAGVHFGALRALDVQHGRPQHVAERRRLFGLALAAAPHLLDRVRRDSR